MILVKLYTEDIMADKSKLGMEFPAYTFTVEKDKIVEFAIAVSQKEARKKSIRSTMMKKPLKKLDIRVLQFLQPFQQVPFSGQVAD